MNTKFFDLSKEKQDRMINGAMQVFAENGYDHASTDDMVKTAGISKGLWFHYFGSKQGLYMFVLDYSLKYLKMELEISFNKSETNYFTIRRALEHTHISLMHTYPYLYLFLKKMQGENSAEVIEELRPYKEQYADLVGQCYAGADWSLVDPRIIREKIDLLLDSTIEAIYRESFRQSVFSLEHLEEEIDDYINLVEIMVK